ncbi:MAG: beta-ketoacyl-ACP synthase III [Planctomycetota bacterium]
MNELREVGIIGTGHYVPERSMTNHDFEKFLETSDEWITQRTGIRARRIAADDQACSDLCVIAAERALDDAGIDASEIDLIIVATVTPDYLLPNTACFVQNRIGAVNAGGWDIANACTGFLSAMMSARGLIASGNIRTALVIGAEKLSSILNWQDRTSAILFGDGAGAMILRADAPDGRILFTDSGLDGAQWDVIQRPAGGSREPLTHEIIEERRHLMSIRGNEVFKFAVRKFRTLIKGSLEQTGHGIDDLTLVVPHQVNQRIIEAAIDALAIDLDRVYVNLDRFGNTSAASVPIAFDEVKRAGRLNKGDLISMVAFGSGLAWGSALVRW